MTVAALPYAAVVAGAVSAETVAGLSPGQTLLLIVVTAVGSPMAVEVVKRMLVPRRQNEASITQTITASAKSLLEAQGDQIERLTTQVMEQGMQIRRLTDEVHGLREEREEWNQDRAANRAWRRAATAELVRVGGDVPRWPVAASSSDDAGPPP